MDFKSYILALPIPKFREPSKEYLIKLYASVVVETLKIFSLNGTLNSGLHLSLAQARLDHSCL